MTARAQAVFVMVAMMVISGCATGGSVDQLEIKIDSTYKTLGDLRQKTDNAAATLDQVQSLTKETLQKVEGLAAGEKKSKGGWF